MSRPQSAYDSAMPPFDTQTGRVGDVNHSGTVDFAHGNPAAASPLAQSMSTAPDSALGGGGHYNDTSSAYADDGDAGGYDRATSAATTAVSPSAPSRSNTLKKKSSVRRADSLKRSSSRRSLKAGSLAGFGGGESSRQYNNFSSTPIPTSGSPTEILANRFQAWRQLLKSLIAYFREIQASYEQRAKATHKVQNVLASLSNPVVFASENGLSSATRILDDYHKRTVAEASKSREIEEDVIGALTGLRSDLGQKIKEIKSLSGDFKNSVDKEKDATRREVEKLQEAIQLTERDDGSAIGKNDPFVVKLGVDRAVERQIDEENYLHRAYLNLESSGRELESIVVGEIQKAYNALAGILKREGDDAYHCLESLRGGPIAMPKDAEWMAFVDKDSHFVDPTVPLRRVEDIEYPGKHHASAVEVRAGMLERKSKYLKSYTPGWYVLSPTHLHEFKSADKIYSQPPVMSLYLPDQKLGSHSQPGSSSHKFMVKGKQSGNMHKGHNWVFRAETYDTMLAWFEDMTILTEKRGEERNAFVRKHARSFSSASRRASVSSDGMEEDEADQVPYSADAASLPSATTDSRPQRPQPGGRFPSDLHVPRARAASGGQSSNASSELDTTIVAGDGLRPGSTHLAYARTGADPYRLEGVTAGTATVSSYNWEAERARGSYFGNSGLPAPEEHHDFQPQQTWEPEEAVGSDATYPSAEPQNMDGDMAVPVIAGLGGAAVGTTAAMAYRDERQPAVASPAPEIPEKSELRYTPPEGDGAEVLTPGASNIGPEVSASGLKEVVVPSAVAVPTSTGDLGVLPSADGPESVSPPRVARKDTEISVSQLHVPGEYPRQK